MGRMIILALGLVFGGVFSQAPEYAQQYRQRLGGAIDELKQVVADFNADAEREGLQTDDALKTPFRQSRHPLPAGAASA